MSNHHNEPFKGVASPPSNNTDASSHSKDPKPSPPPVEFRVRSLPSEQAQERSRVRDLNDTLRRSLTGGRVMMSRGVEALGYDNIAKILGLVRTYDSFQAGDDPYQEHDFGKVDHDGRTVFWKIDYFDRQLICGSDDPSDPAVTTRVLTILLAEEW